VSRSGMRITTSGWEKPGRKRRLRWYDLVPEAVLAAGLGLFLIDQTDAATSAFKSSRAIGMMAVAAAAWLVARALTTRLAVPPPVRLGIFGVAAAGILAVVVIPAYDDDTVVETFPVVAADPAPVAGTSPVLAPATTAPAGPTLLRRAAFEGIDHRAEGTVSIYRGPDGGFVVGLEEFDIQPGPDYDVYIVPGRDQHGKGGGNRLDDLRGNRGTQYYDVPAGIDIGSGVWTVLVWCQTFAVPVANATPV
jgi:hypothetical protein